MEHVTVEKVHVAVGDKALSGQTLFEVETEKAISSVVSPAEGFVRKIFITAGEVVREKAILSIVTDSLDEPFDDLADLSIDSNQSGSPRERSNQSPHLKEAPI